MTARPQYATYSYGQLQDILRERHLRVTGYKAELVTRLRNDDKYVSRGTTTLLKRRLVNTPKSLPVPETARRNPKQDLQVHGSFRNTSEKRRDQVRSRQPGITLSRLRRRHTEPSHHRATWIFQHMFADLP